MAKHKETIYLTWNARGHGSNFVASNIDLSCLDAHTAVTSVEVEFDIGEFDSRMAEIESLEQAVESVRAESQHKINLLLERISNLKAIGYEP